MIKDLEDYLLTLNPDITFAQISDEPDNLINASIYSDTKEIVYKNSGIDVVKLITFVRSDSYGTMLVMEEEMVDLFRYTFDVSYGNIRIVHTRKLNSQEPLRDTKNRYCMYSEYEIIIERK